MNYALIAPILLLLWALSPWCIRKGDIAQKRIFWATYPSVSRRGNNPSSQKVHEGGGYRFTSLMTVVVMFALAAIPVATTDGLIFVLIGQFLALPGVFLLTRKWVDIAEHGAEIIHAQEQGLTNYREEEIERLVEDKNFPNAAAADAALRKAHWRARVIRVLGSW